MPLRKVVPEPRFVADEREAPTQQMSVVPDSGSAATDRSLTPAEATRSGVRPAFTDEERARIERRERRDTLPAPPEDGD